MKKKPQLFTSTGKNDFVCADIRTEICVEYMIQGDTYVIYMS